MTNASGLRASISSVERFADPYLGVAIEVAYLGRKSLSNTRKTGRLKNRILSHFSDMLHAVSLIIPLFFS